MYDDISLRRPRLCGQLFEDDVGPRMDKVTLQICGLRGRWKSGNIFRIGFLSGVILSSDHGHFGGSGKYITKLEQYINKEVS